MKALVKHSPGDGNVGILDVEEPLCGPHQVKVEVAFCGVCGTDIHVWHDTFRNYPPVILEHEFAGRVVEIGSHVAGVALDECVACLGATAITCGHCRYCVSGKFIFCSNRRGMGHGVNGGFARYVVMRPDQLYRVPKGLPLEEAAISEPFAAAIVNVGTRNLLDAIRETDGLGVDVAFECAGHENSVRGCIEALRPMGNYTQVGICGQEIQFPMDQVFYKQLKLSGSVCYTAQTWDRMMKIYDQGRVRLNDVISNKLPISEWRTAFDLCTQRRALKVLMYPEL